MRRLARIAALLTAAGTLSSAAPLRALIFSGRNNHDWRTTTPYLRRLLDRTGRFDVRVEEEPAGVSAATLSSYDVLVLDYQGPRWGEAAEKAVLGFVRSGKGLVAIHGASYAFSGLDVLGDGHRPSGLFQPPWREYTEMVGGTWSNDAPKTGHAPRHRFTVKYTDREHPIARGAGDGFDVCDELYHSIHTVPGIHALATAWDDPKIGGTGKDEPMLWTVQYGKGRVFYTALGHDVAAMQEPGFAISFVRGTEWAAAGAVSLPAEFPERRAQAPVRAHLVTGGHDHDPSFYATFEGDPRIVVNVVPHPQAFTRDIRKEADVLVLYDLVQDLSDARRNNLREFVEGGKGLVVLHHAIADYNDWNWWYEDVVGGRYLLKPDGAMPASKYKHDEDVYVEVVAKHPVVNGLAPMHLRDETYKDVWISPKVKVLLKTDCPTSDGPVAWISPYEKSRVIYIELGHDQQAHQNPQYRELVRRAILWAAGRLE
jgi:type 1 glutamine amidotransferase